MQISEGLALFMICATRLFLEEKGPNHFVMKGSTRSYC